nr:nascent polypeptide-associated complex subunit alpha, muscle-specific form isoform X1 [Nothobranchius furzeri]
MSADDFQTKYAFVMEGMLKSAIAETTKLFENMVDELKAEISQIKKENEDLKKKCFQYETARRKPVKAAAESSPAQERSDVSEKCDIAVQCDIVPYCTVLVEECQSLMGSTQQSQGHQCALDSMGQTFQDHNYFKSRNPEMSVVLVKQEELDNVSFEFALKQEKADHDVVSGQMLTNKSIRTSTGAQHEKTRISQEFSAEPISSPRKNETGLDFQLPCSGTDGSSQGVHSQSPSINHSIVISLKDALRDDIKVESEVFQIETQFGDPGELATSGKRSSRPQENPLDSILSINEQTRAVVQQHFGIHTVSELFPESTPVNKEMAPNGSEHQANTKPAPRRTGRKVESEVFQIETQFGAPGELATSGKLSRPQENALDSILSINEQTIAVVQQHFGIHTVSEPFPESTPVNKEMAPNGSEHQANTKPAPRRTGRPPKKRPKKSLPPPVAGASGVLDNSDISVTRQTDIVPSLPVVKGKVSLLKSSKASSSEFIRTLCVVSPVVQDGANILLKEQKGKKNPLPALVEPLSCSFSYKGQPTVNSLQNSTEVEVDRADSQSFDYSLQRKMPFAPHAELPQASSAMQRQCCTPVSLQDALLFVDAMNQSSIEHTVTPSQITPQPQVYSASPVSPSETSAAQQTAPVEAQPTVKTLDTSAHSTVESLDQHLVLTPKQPQQTQSLNTATLPVSSSVPLVSATETVAQPRPLPRINMAAISDIPRKIIIVKKPLSKASKSSGMLQTSPSKAGPTNLEMSPPSKAGPTNLEMSPPSKAGPTNLEMSPPSKAGPTNLEMSPPSKAGPTNLEMSPPSKADSTNLDMSPPSKAGPTNLEMSPPSKADSTNLDMSPPSKAGPTNLEMSPPSKAGPKNLEMSPPSKAGPKNLEMSPPSKAGPTNLEMSPPSKAGPTNLEVSPPSKAGPTDLLEMNPSLSPCGKLVIPAPQQSTKVTVWELDPILPLQSTTTAARKVSPCPNITVNPIQVPIAESSKPVLAEKQNTTVPATSVSPPLSQLSSTLDDSRLSTADDSLLAEENTSKTHTLDSSNQTTFPCTTIVSPTESNLSSETVEPVQTLVSADLPAVEQKLCAVVRLVRLPPSVSNQKSVSISRLQEDRAWRRFKKMSAMPTDKSDPQLQKTKARFGEQPSTSSIQNEVSSKKLPDANKTETGTKSAKRPRLKSRRRHVKNKTQTESKSKILKMCKAEVWYPPTLPPNEVPIVDKIPEPRLKVEFRNPVIPPHPIPTISPFQPLAVIGRHLLRNQCGECGRVFENSTALESHVSLHNIYRPFTCKLCGKYFPDSKTFKRHDRVHRNGRIHLCPLCGKGFVYRYSVTKHIQMVHRKLKPFVCQICNKEFHNKLDVEGHIRSHTGERPYKCDLCDRRFIRRIELNLHLRWHKGEKRHWCSYCGKGFLDGNNLKRHLLTHTGEKPHACPHCHKRFKQTGHVKKHVLTVHRDLTLGN